MALHFQSWGRIQSQTDQAVPVGVGQVPKLPESSFLPVGLGRSYGDACLNGEGTLLLMEGRKNILSTDWDTGLIRLDGGFTLGALAEASLPQGWFPPVLPGTRHVTIGGAIANDVHGKNHHRAGSFGNHVTRLWLLRSDRPEPFECSPQKEPELFRATIGGLGLTGVILSAEIQLKKVEGPYLEVEFLPFDDLDTFANLTVESDETWEYTVAWIDLVAASADRLPGIFMRGNHVPDPAPDKATSPHRALFKWPFTLPLCPFNRFSCGSFNRLYGWRQRLRKTCFRQHYGAFFHPLDVIDDWNKLYGPRGFFQYQCVIPESSGLEPFREIFRQLREHRTAVPLAVLKQTGSLEAAGWLSFPMPGWTLAMDIPNKGEKTLQLFKALDDIVGSAGGRLYPAKDAAMGSSFFQSGYPRWRELEAVRDPAIQSDFWKRVTGSFE
ncbi:MAG: FAD-binding protein [Puniceicoccaceae bacterium]